MTSLQIPLMLLPDQKIPRLEVALRSEAEAGFMSFFALTEKGEPRFEDGMPGPGQPADRMFGPVFSRAGGISDGVVERRDGQGEAEDQDSPCLCKGDADSGEGGVAAMLLPELTIPQGDLRAAGGDSADRGGDPSVSVGSIGPTVADSRSDKDTLLARPTDPFLNLPSMGEQGRKMRMDRTGAWLEPAMATVPAEVDHSPEGPFPVVPEEHQDAVESRTTPVPDGASGVYPDGQARQSAWIGIGIVEDQPQFLPGAPRSGGIVDTPTMGLPARPGFFPDWWALGRSAVGYPEQAGIFGGALAADPKGAVPVIQITGGPRGRQPSADAVQPDDPDTAPRALHLAEGDNLRPPIPSRQQREAGDMASPTPAPSADLAWKQKPDGLLGETPSRCAAEVLRPGTTQPEHVRPAEPALVEDHLAASGDVAAGTASPSLPEVWNTALAGRPVQMTTPLVAPFGMADNLTERGPAKSIPASAGQDMDLAVPGLPHPHVALIRTDGPLHVPAAAPAMPATLHQIVEIALAHGEGVSEVQLAPEELGKVHIALRTEGERVAMTMLAERPETQDLLRRHADRLATELRAAGFLQVELSFGSWAQSGGGRDSGQFPPEMSSEPLAETGSLSGSSGTGLPAAMRTETLYIRI